MNQFSMIPLDLTQNLIRANRKASLNRPESSSVNCLSTTRLEHLPNELFYSIFNYLGAGELFESFFGLNSRFNSLLFSLSPCHLCLEAKTSSDAINFYVSKIKSMHVKTDCRVFSLDPFHETLRSLTLDSLPEKHICELYKLVHLERLKLHITGPIFIISKLYQFLISSSQLRHLVIPHWYFTNLLPHLYSLRISDNLNDNDFSNVLANTPNLVGLQVNIPQILLHQTIDGRLRNAHKCLRYFHLSLPIGFTHSQLDFYLAHMPNLESFHFLTRPCLVFNNQAGPYNVLNCIATIVDNRLSNLRRFSCTIIFSMASNDVFDMSRIHPLFTQSFSIKLGRNIQQIDSKWRKN